MNSERTVAMRSAVAAGDWQTAMRLWEQYAAAILEEIEQRTCAPGRLKEAREFLEWAQRVVLCARAQAQLSLNRIHAAKQYEPPAMSPRSSLRASF